MSDEPVNVEVAGDVAWVFVDNPPVNATSVAVRAGLLRAVGAVRGARIAVLICMGRTFIAGGDMAEFDAPPKTPDLPDVVRAIEDSAVPFVAAMHGSVLGGGLEVALGCAWRIAMPGTRFGLPEVNVGLIPGAGGSQRLPRLVGLEMAIDMAAEGRTFDADAMASAGGLDWIATGPDLRDAAGRFAADPPSRPRPLRERAVGPVPPEVLAKRRDALELRARGQSAPLRNLDALLWSYRPFDEGQPMERALHLEMRQSAESRALRHAFFAERRVAWPSAIKGVEPRRVKSAAVVGGGLMGAGIAVALLGAGLPVTLIERDPESAEAAADRVRRSLENARLRGRIREAERKEQIGRFAVATDHNAAQGHDLAIEAVYEEIEIKREVFVSLAGVMDPGAILATNTSYLDPRAIFEGIAESERCVGLHFFSPAHVMRLLEVVRLPGTIAATLAAAFALARRMDKVPVLAGICEGFIGNRMLAAYRREAEYLLADGALPEQVDGAMRRFGFPMGPFEAQDMGGLQIAWANRVAKARTRDPGERYVAISDALCDLGRLGQRAGAGWYDYPDGPKSRVRSPEVAALISNYSKGAGIVRRSFTDVEISERMVAVLANEGARVVEEGVAEHDDAVDMVQIHGFAFPRWRGGPMHYAGQVGWSRIAATMAKVAKESPGSWQAAERLGGRPR